MKKAIVCCGLALLITVSTAQAYTVTIESRVSGGAQNSLFTLSGIATTTAKSTASGLTGTGSYYAGDTTPAKWGDWAFTPAAGMTGYYDVFGTWATNAYAAGVTAPTWTVNNAGTAVTAQLAQTSGANAWNTLATGVKFNAGTAYKTRLSTAATGVSNKRTYFDSVRWVSKTPTAATNTGVANGALNIPQTGLGNELTWSAGSWNSFFDIFLDTNASPVTNVGANLAEGTTSFDPDSLNLLANTTYYWKVVAKNTDLSAAGTVWSFTTAPDGRSRSRRVSRRAARPDHGAAADGAGARQAGSDARRSPPWGPCSR